MKELLTVTLVICSLSITAQPNWNNSLEMARAEALTNNQLILVDFTTSWCKPCQEMDRNVWTDSTITALSQKYVPVKIDLDAHPEVAQRFQVRSIPRVMLIDANKLALEDKSGYQDVQKMEYWMSKYPANVQIINNAMLPLLQDEKNYIAHYNTGLAYGKYLELLEDPAKNSFLQLSNYHLKSAEKLARKDKDLNYQEKAIIGMAMNEAYLQNHDQTLKTLEKYGLDKFSESHLAYVQFVLAYSAKKADHQEAYDKYLNKISTMKGAQYFTGLLDKM